MVIFGSITKSMIPLKFVVKSSVFYNYILLEVLVGHVASSAVRYGVE